MFVLFLFVAVVIGVFLIRKGAQRAEAAGSTRDRISVPASPAALEAIARWADANNYELGESTPERRRYRKGNALTSGQPAFLDVATQGDELVLESYVTAVSLTRKPLGDMALSAPGMILAGPRRMAKRVHNVLRTDLGLPPIA